MIMSLHGNASSFRDFAGPSVIACCSIGGDKSFRRFGTLMYRLSRFRESDLSEYRQDVA